MSRIWLLEPGCHVLDIQDHYRQVEYSINNFPIGIRGWILDPKEQLEEINLADNDVLLYEVEHNQFRNKHGSFIFKAK